MSELKELNGNIFLFLMVIEVKCLVKKLKGTDTSLMCDSSDKRQNLRRNKSTGP